MTTGVAEKYLGNLEPEVINVPPFASVIDDEGNEFVRQLANRIRASLSEKVRPQAIILLHSGNSIELGKWRADLGQRILHSEIVKRIWDFRQLLRLMRRPDLSIYFFFQGACFDDRWELALASRAALALDTQSIVGFPALRYGLFPLGGTLEGSVKNRIWSKEKWSAQSTMHCRQAWTEGLLFLVGDVDDQLGFATAWVKKNQAWLVAQRHGGRSQMVSAAADSFEYFEKEGISKIIASASGPGELFRPTEWGVEACWRIFQAKDKASPPYRAEASIINHIANQFFSDTYVNYLLRGAPGVFPLALECENLRGQMLFIRVGDSGPPFRIILRLASQNLHMHFVSEDSKSLASYLERLFVRLENRFSSEAAKALWSKNISWHVGSQLPRQSASLHCGENDTMILSRAGRSWAFYRPAGNHSDAKIGVSEAVKGFDDLDPAFTKILPMISDGIIETPGISHNAIPLAVWLRSKLLEELLRICRTLSVDLDRLLKGMPGLGWLGLSDEGSWDLFLHSRFISWPGIDVSDRFVQLFGPTRDSWNLASWKQARQQSLKFANERAGDINPAAISWHLAIFCGVLSGVVFGSGLTRDRKAADRLCMDAVGYPMDLLPPSEFFAAQNPKRTRAVIKNCWPETIASGTVASFC